MSHTIQTRPQLFSSRTVRVLPMPSPINITSPPSSFLFTISLLLILFAMIGKLRPWPDAIAERLLSLEVPAADIRTDPHATAQVSTDFGLLTRAAPAAVFYPSSPGDVAALVRFSYSSPRPFAVAARGSGHSIRGQALVPGGVVIDMRSLGGGRYSRINVSTGSCDDRRAACGYVDAGGEQLWIDVLRESLEHGLAPRSWTDYLYLTVGGTLSNAGISGQAFRHGPQISNVYELDVITGKGEMVTCSPAQNSELFFAVLGGLGQFGIITRARIAVASTPEKVRWIRLIYTDFTSFTRDQELLIELDQQGFDYVEGYLLMDQSLISNWRSSFFSDSDLESIGKLAAEFGSIYCLEGAVYYSGSDATSSVDEELELLLKQLSVAPGFVFANDVSYMQFLNRVHDGELRLRSIGLWDVPHPWLNMFVPRSRIHDFEAGVFKGIIKGTNSMGPILVYPMKKDKWDERMSAVIPDEDVFYTIGLLRSAVTDDWEMLDKQNTEILRFCEQEGIMYKQYLPHHATRGDWEKHFGRKWDKFVEIKRKYDPRALLSPGQGIFASSFLDHDASSRHL